MAFTTQTVAVAAAPIETTSGRRRSVRFRGQDTKGPGCYTVIQGQAGSRIMIHSYQLDSDADIEAMLGYGIATGDVLGTVIYGPILVPAGGHREWVFSPPLAIPDGEDLVVWYSAAADPSGFIEQAMAP